MDSTNPFKEPSGTGQSPAALDALFRRIAEITDIISGEAARRELERRLPHEAFSLLRDARIGALRIPAALGGAGATVRDTLSAISRLASGDSNVAHALRSHFNFVETLLLGPPERLERYLPSILRGEIYAGAHTELATPRPGEIRTRLSRRGEGYCLDGRKYYATGAAFADRLFISAVDEHDRPVSVEIEAGRAGVLIQDDWDGMGQRLTSSGSIVLQQVRIAPEEIEWRDSAEPTDDAGRHAATFRQLYLAACQAGIVRNVLSDAVGYVQNIARPITHGHADRSVDDLFVQRTLGLISARAFAIDVLIEAAADRIDRAFDGILRHDPASDGLLLESALATAKAQTVIGELAQAAATHIFDTGGGSATRRSLNFDRHWRNIRTLLGHNPSDYKSKVVGAYELKGERPPLDGGFF